MEPLCSSLRQTVGVLSHHNKQFITGQSELQMYHVSVSKKQNYLAFPYAVSQSYPYSSAPALDFFFQAVIED